MATISTTEDDIKRNVWELAVIALEDKVSKDKIEHYRSLYL